MSAVAVPSRLQDDSADVGLSRSWLQRVQRIAALPFVARSPREAAADLVAAATLPGRVLGEHVHLANAYSVSLADTTPLIADVFNGGRGWLLPDGRPLTWISALRGSGRRLRQVRGPQFMLDTADLGRAAGLRHFLLGGTPETLERLQENLLAAYPGIRIVGVASPPFRTATPEELAARDGAIRRSGAQVVWVGLGTPKQDFEAKRLADSLPVVAVAVGAAFDYAAGDLRSAPRWVSVAGLEWLWRLAAEPRRLWKRYTIGNARFLRAVVRRRGVDRVAAHSAAPVRTTVVGQLPPPLHGSAVMTLRLQEALSELGDRVRMVDRRFSRTVDEVGRIGLRKLVAAPSLVARFALAAIRSDRIVLLITSSPGSFLLDALLLSLTRRPVVLYVHTVGFAALAARGRMWALLVRRAFRRAGRVVVLGPSLRDDLDGLVERERVTVIRNAVPNVRLLPHVGGARLLFLANLLPGKGADVFVRIARALESEHGELPWRFELAGAGNDRALGALPASLTVHGRVEGEDKERLLQHSDVLVVPSTYAMEAQPLVIVEALAHGLPVVAYDTGGIRDLVDDEVGALVPTGNEAALTAAVLALVQDRERLAAAGAAARHRFEAHHSLSRFTAMWEAVLADDVEAYEAVLGQVDASPVDRAEVLTR